MARFPWQLKRVVVLGVVAWRYHCWHSPEILTAVIIAWGNYPTRKLLDDADSGTGASATRASSRTGPGISPDLEASTKKEGKMSDW